MSIYLIKIWRWILGSRLVQGALAALAVVGWYLIQVGKAKREGRDNERERIETAATKETEKIKDRANATHERNRNLSGDDLRRRMREQSRDGEQS